MKAGLRRTQSLGRHQTLPSNKNGIHVTGTRDSIISPAPDTEVPEKDTVCPEGIARDAGQFDDRVAHALKFAWAAGFVDGDGCICPVIQRHDDRATDSVRIRLVVTQNDRHVLEVLRTVLGERCALNATKRLPCQNRQAYQLQYDSGHAIEAIRKILPYLIRKRREADLCLQLFVDGQLNRNPGPKGFPPEVHRVRKSLVRRIRRMK